MQFSLHMSLSAAVLLALCGFLAAQAEAWPLSRAELDAEIEPENEAYVNDLIQELSAKRNQAASPLASYAYSRGLKRGLDFGLSRGSSGSKTAQHLLGLSIARDPTGPGRRR